MKQTNLEIIRKACIKANPEIMEIKRGCIVNLNKQWIDPEFWDKDFIIYKTEADKFAVTGKHQKSDIGVWLDKSDISEILGREIRLSDVLLALQGKEETDSWQFYLPDILWISFKRGGAFQWDLTHDNLELQSEETINFLSELLK